MATIKGLHKCPESLMKPIVCMHIEAVNFSISSRIAIESYCYPIIREALILQNQSFRQIVFSVYEGLVFLQTYRH